MPSHFLSGADGRRCIEPSDVCWLNRSSPARGPARRTSRQRPTTNDRRQTKTARATSPRAVSCQSCCNLLVRQLEVNQDLGLDRHRVAVQVVGLVLPLLDGFLGGARQNCVSADHFQILDIAGLVDGGL